eukprot:1778061-Amphidinium_carterae.2
MCLGVIHPFRLYRNCTCLSPLKAFIHLKCGTCSHELRAFFHTDRHTVTQLEIPSSHLCVVELENPDSWTIQRDCAMRRRRHGNAVPGRNCREDDEVTP